MHRLSTLVLTVIAVAGCSRIVDLAFKNDTGTAVDICNLHRRANACVSAPSHSLVKVPLVSDEAAPSWVFRISSNGVSKTYDFGHIELWKLRSADPCSNFSRRGCEVRVQLGQDGLIYWVDSSNAGGTTPPMQPDGFPVSPGA
jgi:hypothetical protein